MRLKKGGLTSWAIRSLLLVSLAIASNLAHAESSCFKQTLQNLLDRKAAPLEHSLPAGNDNFAALETARLQEQFLEIRSNKPWDDWVDYDADFTRFIEAKTYLHKKPYQTGSELYGKNVYLGWKTSDNFLRSIPRGKLRLDLDLVQKVHGLATPKYFSEFSEKYGQAGKAVGALLSEVRGRGNYLGLPLRKPLSEHDFLALKNNFLLKLIELPFPLSKKDARRGLLSCVDHDQVIPELEKLLSWYNENKTKLDPIQLAARFQREFVSIHPFIDGNGRTSRLLMDRILAEHDLPPPILPDMNADIFSSPEEWEATLRRGIQAHLEIIKTSNRPRSPPISVGTSPTRLAADHPSYSSIAGKDFFVGDQVFRVGQDGFLHSNQGIPHVYHDGRIFPVSDRTYYLYGKNGTISDEYRAIIKSNYGLVESIQNGTLKSRNIEVVSYSGIESSNANNSLFLYPWQKDLFKKVIRIDETRPEQVLNRNLSSQSRFEFVHSGKDSPRSDTSELFHVIAQYEVADREFYDYMKVARERFPDLVPEVLKSRQKLHKAARELLNPFLADIKRLSPEEQSQLSQVPRFKAIQEYLAHSKLGMDSFDQAVSRLGDDHMLLFRNEMSHVRLLGFNSPKVYNEFFERLPGHQNFLKFVRYFYHEIWLKKILPKFAKNPSEAENYITWSDVERTLPSKILFESSSLAKTVGKMDDLLRRLIRNFILDQRDLLGTDDAFKRTYVDYVLHTSDHGLKRHVSFTSNPGYLIPNAVDEVHDLKFTPGAGTFADVYLVKVPKDNAHWNYSSDWFNAYEFLVDKSLPRNSIVHTFSGKELLNAKLSEHSPRLQDFASKWLNQSF